MDDIYNQQRARAIALVRTAHAGQKRSDGPVWHHLDRVSRLLEIILGETKEGTETKRQTISLAALGHDSLEDTSVTAEELRAVFGQDGLALIEGMTNRFGDDHPEPYVKQVAAAAEEVRLIKLSDLYDNCTSVIFTLNALGPKWNDEFFLPIVRPMVAAVLETEFKTYPETAKMLKSMVRASFTQLLDEHQRAVSEL